MNEDCSKDLFQLSTQSCNDTIDESRVLKKAAQITKGGSEPSGLDAGVVRDSV